jgi:hypothetical protein
MLNMGLIRSMLAISASAGVALSEEHDITIGSVLEAPRDEPDDDAVIPVARYAIEAQDEILIPRRH